MVRTPGAVSPPISKAANRYSPRGVFYVVLILSCYRVFVAQVLVAYLRVRVSAITNAVNYYFKHYSFMALLTFHTTVANELFGTSRLVLCSLT